jgi:hypothetical protein
LPISIFIPFLGENDAGDALATIFDRYFLAFVVICVYCIGSLAFNFPGHDITQYGISIGSPQALESITACFWMSAPEAYVKYHRATLLSYTTAKGELWGNDFLLMLRPQLELWINNIPYRYEVESSFSR